MMSGALKFPNWQSRLLLGSAARKQPFHSAKLPRPVESFLQWYERSVLKVDISDIKVDRPVFLIGMPRSGTTMLQDIMCAHPGLVYVNNAMNRFPTTFCAIEHFRRRLRLDFEGERFLGDSVLVSASSPSDAIAFWAEWFKEDPFSLQYRKVETKDFSQAEIQRMQDTIRKVIWCYGDPSKRFFNSLRTVMHHLHVIKEIFPDAKFVHIIRDARFTANSMVKLCRLVMDQQLRLKSYGEDPKKGKVFLIPYPRFPRLAEYVEQFGADDVRTTARLWNDMLSYLDGLRDSIAHFYEVRFEDILAAPAEQIERILDFCELPPVEEDNTAFWEKIGGVGHVTHRNKYDNFDLIESICRENLKIRGYLN